MRSAAQVLPTVLAPLRDNCERALAQFGPNYRGVLLPRELDAQKRLEAIVALWRWREPAFAGTILDLGCGYGELLDCFEANSEFQPIEYWGVDVSARMIESARQRHPSARFELRDILSDPLPEMCVDYVVINQVLTAKFDIPQKTMIAFAKRFIAAAFRACRKGLVFNAQNWHVNHRNDLFHWRLDQVAAFFSARCSKHIVFRMDYGLYDFMAYVYRTPAGGGHD